MARRKGKTRRLSNPLPRCDLAKTGRALTPAKAKRLGRVRIHVNLHNGCVVVSASGRVQGYAKSVRIKGVLPRIGMAGYRKCKRDQVRNVHAYLDGELVSASTKRPSGKGWRRISYACKTRGPNFYYVKGGKAFAGAAEARLLFNKGKLEVWVKGKARKENPPSCPCRNPAGQCSCGRVDSERPAGCSPCEENPGLPHAATAVVYPSGRVTVLPWPEPPERFESLAAAQEWADRYGVRLLVEHSSQNPAGDARLRGLERAAATGGYEDRQRYAAARRRAGDPVVTPTSRRLPSPDVTLPTPPPGFRDFVLSVVWGFLDNLSDDYDMRRLNEALWNEIDSLAFGLQVYAQEWWNPVRFNDLQEQWWWSVSMLYPYPGPVSTAMVYRAIEQIMPYETRRKNLARVWSEMPDDAKREVDAGGWRGVFLRPKRIVWSNPRRNPVRPCGSSVRRLGVHLIQRRPHACVVLLDLENVDEYDRAELAKHGACPLLAGWGVRGGPSIARGGLEGRLAAELAQKGSWQFSPQLVALASRLGMDLLALENMLCQEGKAWHDAKGYDPASAMLLLNNPDESLRRLEREAAVDPSARRRFYRASQRASMIRGRLHVGPGGVKAALAMRDALDQAGGWVRGANWLPKLRAPHYTVYGHVSIVEETEMARDGILLLDEVDAFRPEVLRAIHSKVMEMGPEAPFVFAVVQDERVVRHLPPWIQGLERTGQNPARDDGRYPRRLDLTGDRPLTKSEARKLANWWQGAGTSVELIKVRRGRWRVIATIFSPSTNDADP